ncbi:uncharacterized protein LOC132047401 [Lycium ferocissimum]|uniref:uncharacterized protein LOC132047401 n=1 Tax=Lycium ferocissimum TaxID=112874 RepID=UPI002815B620|nr:uncharacterized protein LOC132047401 [Lycium ferocissimum]
MLVNGQAHGFFHSTKGVKQGDPLSPALFILSAEVLTRALNALFDGQDFKRYMMPKWSSNLNHLAYADDTIVFASADKKSLELTMSTLKAYEDSSGCPITHARKRKVDYTDLIKKIRDKLQAWKGKLLSPGGDSSDFAKFFWSSKEDVKAKYWAAWLKMCLPIEERGLGFRSLFDVSKALNAKL